MFLCCYISSCYIHLNNYSCDSIVCISVYNSNWVRFHSWFCSCVAWVMFLGLFVVVTVCCCGLKVHFWIIISWLNVDVVVLLNLYCLLIIKYYPFSIYDNSYYTLLIFILTFYNSLYYSLEILKSLIIIWIYCCCCNDPLILVMS